MKHIKFKYLNVVWLRYNINVVLCLMSSKLKGPNSAGIVLYRLYQEYCGLIIDVGIDLYKSSTGHGVPGRIYLNHFAW